MTNGGRGKRRRKVSCGDCFFRVNGLCALDFSEPCPTFRPAGEDGLVPPAQLTLVERQEPLERRGGLLDLAAA